MVEPTSVASALFSGLNAIIKGVSYGAHFADVPKEVTQLQQNIQTADLSINTAKRLLQHKTHYLNPHLVKESQASIDNVESVLRHVRDSIEACRKDLEVKRTVSVKHRAIWILWKNQEFLSKLETLNTCLGALNRDILRLEMASPPPVVLVGGISVSPDVGGDAYFDPGRDAAAAATRLRSKASFARSPSKRWVGNSASTSTFDLNSSSANNSRVDLRSMKSSSTITLVSGSCNNDSGSGLGVRTGDGDEGYQSDDGLSTRSSRLSLRAHSNSVAKLDDADDDNMAFIAGSGLSVDLDERRTSISRKGSSVYARTSSSQNESGVYARLNDLSISDTGRPHADMNGYEMSSAGSIFELPGSYPSSDSIPASAQPDTLASYDPRREQVLHELLTPESDWKSGSVRSKRSCVPSIVEVEVDQDTDNTQGDMNFLSPSVTAPASMVTTGSEMDSSTMQDRASLLTNYERKRLQRRRRSDFIG